MKRLIKNTPSEFHEAMAFLGMTRVGSSEYRYLNYINSHSIKVIASHSTSGNNVYIELDGEHKYLSNSICSVAKTIEVIESSIRRYGFGDIISFVEMSQEEITAAINTRDLTRDLVRVQSSNVYKIGFHAKKYEDRDGTLFIQFLGKDNRGFRTGPGPLYCYYEVPKKVYRGLVGASSKGAYVWRYIRNVYSYSRLDGSKRGVLPNAVN